MSNGVVIVAGALANKPCNGGNAWTRLNWLLAFRKMGFDTYFIEQIDPANCVGPDGRRSGAEDSINVAFFRAVMKRFGFDDHATLLCDGTAAVVGAAWDRVEELVGRADILLNISGHLQWPRLKLPPRRRIYLDDDPGYTQIWHANGQLGDRLADHDCYFTLGVNIGSQSCRIPTAGIPWQPIRVPVVLAEWPPVAAQTFDRFTSVASWRGPFGTINFDGTTYGPKAHEFRKFIDLPRKTGRKFGLALDIHPADWKDRQSLANAGWEVVSPELTATPDAFRDYVQSSSAEFSVAQPIYVGTNTGWFSDRSAAYLASGKPTLIQDTGFSRNLPTGDGLVAFTNLEEAIAGAEEIASNYAHHCRVARDLAQEYFDSDKILDKLLSQIAASECRSNK